MSTINETIINDIKSTFTKNDKNKDGKLSIEELVQTLKKAGTKTPERSAVVLFKCLDKNMDDYINFDDMTLSNSILKKSSSYEECAKTDVEAFLLKFKNNDRVITPHELTQMLTELGSKNVKNNCKWIFDNIEKDQDGNISYDLLENYVNNNLKKEVSRPSI